MTKQDKIELFEERVKLIATIKELTKFKENNNVFGGFGIYLLNAEYAQVLIEHIENKIVLIDNKLEL
jgi:hypothetical protein